MRQSIEKSRSKTKMTDPIAGDEEYAYILSLSNDSLLEFEGFDLDELTIVSKVHAVFAIDLCYIVAP